MKNIGIEWRIILNCDVKKWNEETWTGLIWLKLGTGEGYVVMR